MEMVECQEAPSHGKNIYGNLTAARHAPSKKVRYTRYYRFLRCALLSVKQNYGKIRPWRAAVVCLPMSNLFSISKILSVTVWAKSMCKKKIGWRVSLWKVYGWKVCARRVSGWRVSLWKVYGWKVCARRVSGWKISGWKVYGWNVLKSLWVKSMVENRGRWDAGFRSPLLRFFVIFINGNCVINHCFINWSNSMKITTHRNAT